MSQINYEKNQNKFDFIAVRINSTGTVISQFVILNSGNITLTFTNVGTGLWNITSNKPTGSIISYFCNSLINSTFTEVYGSIISGSQLQARQVSTGTPVNNWEGQIFAIIQNL